MRADFHTALGAFLSLRREQWMGKEDISRLAGGRLTRAIAAASKTEYYSRRMESLGIRSSSGDLDIGDFPTTPKEHVRSWPRSFIAAREAPLASAATSGSSGRPTKIFLDKESLAYRSASHALSVTEFGLSPFDLLATVSDEHYRSFPLLCSLIFRSVHIPVFQDPSAQFSAILSARPDVIGWYPSVLRIMASENDAAGNPLRLKRVFCGAETLSSGCRHVLERSFSCPVLQQYGACETGVIAWECPEERRLHISSGTNYVEILDSKGRAKKSGPGRIVVTALRNNSMPLLRYEIGDIGSWGGDCKCGRGLPTLGSLEGRSDDLLVLPSGKVRSARSINLMDDLLYLREYQISQEESGLFVFRYACRDRGPSGRKSGLSDHERADITQRIVSGCAPEPVRVEFECVDRIQRGGSGKLNAVVSPYSRALGMHALESLD